MAYAIVKRVNRKQRYIIFESKSMRAIMNKIAVYGGEEIEFTNKTNVQKIITRLFRNNNFEKLKRVVTSIDRNNVGDGGNMWLINKTEYMEEFFNININHLELERINDALIDIGLSELQIITIDE